MFRIFDRMVAPRTPPSRFKGRHDPARIRSHLVCGIRANGIRENNARLAETGETIHFSLDSWPTDLGDVRRSTYGRLAMRAGFNGVSVAMRLRDSGGLARSRLCGGARLGGDYFACRLADNIGSIPDRHCAHILSYAYLESPGYVQYSTIRAEVY
jgi:hypothetical protein